MDNALHALSTAMVNAMEETTRQLGREAGESAGTWIEPMSADWAERIHHNVDPMILDNYSGPNLSGELAGGPTPRSVLAETLNDLDIDTDPDDVADWIADNWFTDPMLDAWEEGASEAFSDALHAVAADVLIDQAIPAI